MGKTAEELRGDIERRRYDLTRDIDAIGDRVSPSRVMERRTGALKERLRNAKESIMGEADHISDRTVDVRDRVGDVAYSSRSSISDAASRAGDGVHHAAEKAGDGVHQAAEKAGEVPDVVRRQTQGNPLAAGVVAFGVGLLVATALPESRRERRLARQVQPRLEDAARTAAGTGRAVVDDVRPAVEQSAEHLRDSAKESAEHVTGQARDAARTVADRSQTAAANVKDAARP
jgi:gas vesicle protein